MRVLVMSEAGFSTRLEKACDLVTDIPEYGHGRGRYIAEYLGVSQESVRKWFSGESRPKPDMMRRLAELVNTEESWLAIGVHPEMDRQARKAHMQNTDGAVMLVRALLTLAGASCAEPDKNDPRASYVDLYVIHGGRQLAIHVSLAREIERDKYEAVIPREYEEVRTLIVIRNAKNAYDCIDASVSLIDANRIRKNGDYVVRMTRAGGKYLSGQSPWPQISDFGTLQ